DWSSPFFKLKALVCFYLLSFELRTFVVILCVWFNVILFNLTLSNVFFVSGQLILSLDKDTYEQLGLEGRPSQYSHRKTVRHSNAFTNYKVWWRKDNATGLRYLDEPKLTSWVSLTVHGCADSPVSWGSAEHGFHKGGENFYNFVCFQNQDYWLHMATGAKDACPP
uniref:Ribonuclease P/MRP 40 subunit n=1 Tax=Astyanax mexicanus TaxID=7994 RepID=A0A8B9GM09_ASTMX